VGGSAALPAGSPWGERGQFSANLFVPIRIALAIMVIFSHSYLACNGTSATEPLARLTGQMTIGELSVDMFLAISGFLVTRSWETSRSNQAFLLKRVLRIFPAFYAVMVIQAFVLAPLVSRDPFTGYNWSQMGLLAFEIADLVGYGYPYGGLLAVFPDNPFPYHMNASLWTIRYEFLCYLLLALGGARFRQTGFVSVFLVAVVATYAIGWLPPWHWLLTAALGDVAYWPRLLAFFMAGVWFYRFRDRIPHDTRLAALSGVMIVAGASLGTHGLRVVLPLAGVYLLFWVAYHPLLLRLPWPNVGDLSYGVYLYGFPIQQSVIKWLSPVVTITPIRLAVIATGLSLIAGLLSWHAIEKRFLALKPRGMARGAYRVDPGREDPAGTVGASHTMTMRGRGV
jgi:peptidoglycan/LPS O-acetylase OafA/YrhL